MAAKKSTNFAVIAATVLRRKKQTALERENVDLMREIATEAESKMAEQMDEKLVTMFTQAIMRAPGDFKIKTENKWIAGRWREVATKFTLPEHK